ncbi:MAG: minor capsid protein [Terrisporobacter sp.]|uniref:minor capsid protein n=1 Tax=Terrisporobacter sp. TaxID=1965305 RepID=UPI0039940E86
MKFFDFFKRDSKMCTEENTEEHNILHNEEHNILIDKDNIKNEEIEILKKLNGYSIEYEIPQYWTDYVGDVDLFIKNVIGSNLLRISTPKDDLISLKVKELKVLLDKKSLDTKGKKDNLIERVADNYTNEELKYIIEWRKRYILTEKGKEIVDSYILNQKQLYNDLIRDVFTLIKELNINDAYIKIANYEKDRVFKRGMGIDWSKEAKVGINKKEEETYKDLLKFEFNNSNLAVVSLAGILLGIDSRKTAKLFKDYLEEDDDLVENIHYIQSIIFSKRQIKEYSELGESKYQIIVAFDKNVCEKCASMDDKVFKCSEAKVGINLPPFCKKCRCTIGLILEDDYLGNGEKSARNPDTGKLFNIPANMRYLDFKKVFIDKEITFDEWKKGMNNKSKK